MLLSKKFFLVVLASSCVSFKLQEFTTEPDLDFYLNNLDRGERSDYEIVYLPAVSSDGEREEIDYDFSMFGRPVNLKLKRNGNLLASKFKTYLNNGDEFTRLNVPIKNCHFLHKDSSTVAAISLCRPAAIQGLLFLENGTFEISPLNRRSRRFLPNSSLEKRSGLVEETVPHVVKRSSLSPDVVASNLFSPRTIENPDYLLKSDTVRDLNIEAVTNKRGSRLTIEVALFFDEAAYRIFAPYMEYDDVKLQDMILAYLNGVQALYHHPSLGTTLDINLVRLDIMKKQPNRMPHYEGERSQLLDSFCKYQNDINPDDDRNPNHWDMALYISGLDFFAYENGRKNGATMGLATVGGVCLAEYNCIIAELGTSNIFGKPYPSAGFTSVYILAHEIGHNLGMHHDSTGNSCPKEGYIMSPSRGTNGETKWSTCSAEVVSKLDWAKCLQDSGALVSHSFDHSIFFNQPGSKYPPKKQCEILLRDRDAVIAANQKLESICYNLQCKTPHRSGFYFAGPALEGTQCGNGKYCYGGDCVKRTPTKPIKITPGGWSPWKTSGCSSGCTEQSLGFQTKQRTCTNPVPVNTDKGCAGSSFETTLCKDDKICRSDRRKPAVQIASEKCKQFSKLLPELDPKGVGLQAPHEENRLWMGCAIFCKRGDSGSFYTPRIELNDLGVSPYFPDGTWCHRDPIENYYCIQHHCLPESFQLTKTNIFFELGEDLPIPQNANPNKHMSLGLKHYLSLDTGGKPIKTKLTPADTILPKNDEWETKDYIELPENMKHF